MALPVIEAEDMDADDMDDAEDADAELALAAVPVALADPLPVMPAPTDCERELMRELTPPAMALEAAPSRLETMPP